MALNAAKGILAGDIIISASVPSFTKPTDRPEIYILLRQQTDRHRFIIDLALIAFQRMECACWTNEGDNGCGFHSIRFDSTRLDATRFVASACASASASRD